MTPTLSKPGIFLLIALSMSCRTWAAPAESNLRILWTNDTHGYLSPLYHREEGDNQYMDRARSEGKVGGFAHIASLVKRQRAEMPDRTLLLDSGDSWHGTAVPVRLGGSPVVEVMNVLGYDAMVPGNVEFFYGQKTLEKLFSAADFPIVAANFYDAKWNESHNGSAELDALIVQARGMVDGPERHAVYCDIQRIIHNEGGSLIPIFTDWLDARSEKLMGWTGHPVAEGDGCRIHDNVWLT